MNIMDKVSEIVDAVGTRKTLQDSKRFNLVIGNADKIAKYLNIPVWK